jgi:cytochrome P450
MSGRGVKVPVPEMIAMMELLAGSVIVSDPPIHDDLRRIAQPAFSLGRRRDLGPVLRAYVSTLLDSVKPGVPFEIVACVAR